MSEVLRGIPRAGTSLGGRIVERAAIRALARLRHGALELRLPGGGVHRAGSGVPIVVTVESNDLFRRLARSPRIGLGESYVAGDWHTDDVPGFVELVIRNVELWRRGSRLARIERLRPHIAPRQSLRKARRNIGYHYDLGNDLYRLFLDESMTYSCAVWEPGDTLEQAQERKLRMICDKLALRPGDHVLEIGCGWGSFALMAAGEYGARVTGVTISQQQLGLARSRVAAAGLADRVEILFQDYRTLEGQFTKIASIEMLEAIGYSQYSTFFAACDRLLAPGGLAAIQVIGMPDQRFERYRRKEDWIQRYIFPGSLLPSLEALQTTMSRSSELIVVGLEEIGPHYADTLHAWREHFFAHLPEVRRLGFDERFVRTWDFYLASCEALFRTRAIRDMQLVLGRPFEEPA
jgi:cyclopropane-fatty-acyl-phospholipid synthase